MKNILYIDTSTNYCKVIFYYRKQILKTKKFTFKSHLNNILPIINGSLKKYNINLNKFNFLSCLNNAEYSLSSIIGLSISKGLSIGLNIPIINIFYFEIISEKIYKYTNIKNNILLIIESFSNSLIFIICNKKINEKWSSITKIISDKNEALNYINNFKGKWIFNGINIEKKFNITFKNIKINYTNFSSCSDNDIIDLILNKINN